MHGSRYYGGIFLPSPQFVPAGAWESQRPLLVHGGAGHFTAMLGVERHTRYIPLFTTCIAADTGTFRMKPLPVRFLRLQVPATGNAGDNAGDNADAAAPAPPPPPPPLPDGDGDTAWYYERLQQGTSPARRRRTLLEVLLGTPITLITRDGMVDLPVLDLSDVPADPPPNAHVRAIQQSFLAGLRPPAGGRDVAGNGAGPSTTGASAAAAAVIDTDADAAALQAAILLSMEGALPRAEYLPGGANSVRNRLVSANSGGGIASNASSGAAGSTAAAAAAAAVYASSSPLLLAQHVYRTATDAVFGPAASAPDQDH